MIVLAREYLRWQRTLPAGEWASRTLDAIKADRQSEDYRNDPDAY